MILLIFLFLTSLCNTICNEEISRSLWKCNCVVTDMAQPVEGAGFFLLRPYTGFLSEVQFKIKWTNVKLQMIAAYMLYKLLTYLALELLLFFFCSCNRVIAFSQALLFSQVPELACAIVTCELFCWKLKYINVTY